MASPVKREPVFVALTRPQMFAGVTYSYFIANAVIAAEFCARHSYDRRHAVFARTALF